MIDTPEYHAWTLAKQRCEDSNLESYKHYGGRGIKMCDRWREDFRNFYEDMGDKPSRDHTLGRINNDGDYDPVNCEWQTKTEQNRNRRTVKCSKAIAKEMRWLWENTSLSQSQIAKKFGVSQMTVSNIVNHKNWK
jgi:hypothetical protein